jgi:hypothetical protein
MSSSEILRLRRGIRLSTCIIPLSKSPKSRNVSTCPYPFGVRQSAIEDSRRVILIPHYAQTPELSLSSAISYHYWNFGLWLSAIRVGRSYIVPLTKSSKLRSCLSSWGLDYVANRVGQARMNLGPTHRMGQGETWHVKLGSTSP